jgi:hypothetical protein
VIAPARLPASWLGYTSLRAVVVDLPAWQAMTDAQRAGLRTWISAGGDLLVVDGSPHEVLGVPAPEGEAPRIVQHLLGHVYRVESADITSAGFDPILTSLRPSREPDWSLPVNRAGDWMLTTRSFRLPIEGVGEVRARSFLAILFVFAVLIGPANFAFLKRRGRQALLVLTAPLVSLVFVLLLGIYVVAAEGFGVHTRVASLTILDQARQESVTRAVVSSYAAGRAPRPDSASLATLPCSR